MTDVAQEPRRRRRRSTLILVGAFLLAMVAMIAIAALLSNIAARKEEGPRSALVGLAPVGRRSPRHGYPVVDPAPGERVGEVTSGSPSPTLGHPIAIAAVAPHLTEVGTKLQIDVRGKLEDAEVVALPFYTRAN